MSLNVAEINCWNELWNQRKFYGSSINIEGLENVKEKREVTMDIMDIERLRLEWSTTDNNSRSLDMDVQVLEGFRLTPKLHHLTIAGYRGCVLPSWMVGDPYLLTNLKSLVLYRCRQLKQLPILPPTLRGLVLDDCSSLPIVSKKDLAIIKSDERISHVATKTMDIVYQNPQEEEEAQLILPSSLEILRIWSCPLTDSKLREGLSGLTSLKSLEINNIVSLTSLTSLGSLQALGSLDHLALSFCPNLSAEGGNTSVLPSSLKWLEIYDCHWKNLDDSQPDLTSSIDSKSSDNIPFAASLQLGHLKLLTTLSITNCPNIGSLLGLQELNNLEDLTLIECPKLIHAETKLGSLKKKFSTDAPSLLYMLLAEEAITSLPELCIEKFEKESFKYEREKMFQKLTSLIFLMFNNCSIESLPDNLESLSSLEKLTIFSCPNIISLPDLPTSLLRINLIDCNEVLMRRCQKPHGEDWPKIAHIPNVFI